MAQTLSAVFTINDKYTAKIKKIIQSQASFEEKQRKIDQATDRFNERLGKMKAQAENGADGISSLTGRLTGLVSVAYLAKKALDLTFSGINTAAVQKVQETTFQALLNSEEAGKNLYRYVSEYAKISALGREDISKGVTTFLTFTRDINQIEQLIKMTERLYAKGPTQGAGGAVFALKEALEGDVISMRNRFGITGLSGEKLRSASATERIEMIDQVLNKFGATQEVVDKNFNGLLTQTNIFTSNLKTMIGEQATATMENLSQVMVRLNENMETGKYQPFINLMVAGMNAIGKGIAFVADNANWLIPIVGGLTVGIIAYKTAQMSATLWTTLAGIAVNGLTGNWAAAIGVVGALTAGVWGLSKAFKSVDKDVMGKVDINSFKEKAGQSLAGAKIPVEVSNTSPLKVTGNVEIEKENVKYLLDIAGKKFFAEFNANTVAPQVNMYNTQVHQTTDLDSVGDYLGNMIYEQAQIQPQGV